jgi:hypothetical protein
MSILLDCLMASNLKKRSPGDFHKGKFVQAIPCDGPFLPGV